MNESEITPNGADIANECAKKLGTEGWKIVPIGFGHVAIVFRRKLLSDGTVLAAVDAAVNPENIPIILFSQLLRQDVAGLWWITRNLFVAYLKVTGRYLGFSKGK